MTVIKEKDVRRKKESLRGVNTGESRRGKKREKKKGCGYWRTPLV
jgi:hypothetical protein